MKFNLLIVLATAILCAAPTCAQIQLPQTPPIKGNPSDATTPTPVNPPTGVNAAVTEAVQREADAHATQVAILLTVRCTSKHDNPEDSEACFIEAVKCYRDKGLWAPLDVVLTCVKGDQ